MVTPVYASGVEVVPAGSIVEGRVTSVSPARTRGREGQLAVQFDAVVVPDGTNHQLEGALTELQDTHAGKVDAENEVSGNSSDKRNVAYVGGGTVGGAPRPERGVARVVQAAPVRRWPLERQEMRRQSQPGRFDFGLSPGQEERAARLHRESIVFDMLSMYAGSNIFAAYPEGLWADFASRMEAARERSELFMAAVSWPFDVELEGGSQVGGVGGARRRRANR